MVLHTPYIRAAFNKGANKEKGRKESPELSNLLPRVNTTPVGCPLLVRSCRRSLGNTPTILNGRRKYWPPTGGQKGGESG